MTMRRSRSERRERIFTTTETALTLTAAGTSISGQQISQQTSADFELRTGRTLRNATVARIWINGLWFTVAAVTTPVIIGLVIGMGVFQESLDAGDFPDLSIHKSSWMLHRTWRLTELDSSDTLPRPLFPNAGSGNSCQIVLDNRSMRRIERDGEKLFLVIQKDIATEEAIQFHVDVTVMWLL